MKQNMIRHLLLLAWLGLCGSAGAMDHVELKRDGQTILVEGRVQVTAKDGGLLVLATDGVPVCNFLDARWSQMPTTARPWLTAAYGCGSTPITPATGLS